MRYKRMKGLCTLLLLLIAFSTNAQAAKKYINGIDKYYPPFAYINEKGKATGFDVDSINWIAKKMGFEVEHKAIEWKVITKELANSKIDMIASGYSITPERGAHIMFSNPYWELKKVFIASNKSNITKEQILNSKSKVGVQRGTDEALLLQNMLVNKEANFELILYVSLDKIIEDVLNAKLDAGAMDSAPAHFAIEHKSPIKELDNFGEVVQFGVAINKSNLNLLAIINEGYRLLMSDPYWNELKQKYSLN